MWNAFRPPIPHPSRAIPASMQRKRHGFAPARLAALGVPVFLHALIVGCASWFVADADREVGAALRKYQDRVLGSRDAWIKRPDEIVPESRPASGGSGLDDGAHRLDNRSTGGSGDVPGPSETQDNAAVLDLAACQPQAFTASRDFQTAKETLYRAGLSYTLVRYNFGPILNSTIGWLWSHSDGATDTQTVNIPLSVRQ